MTIIDLAGRHALITGGLRSIGLALVQSFSASGAKVTVLDRPGGTAPDACLCTFHEGQALAASSVITHRLHEVN